MLVQRGHCLPVSLRLSIKFFTLWTNQDGVRFCINEYLLINLYCCTTSTCPGNIGKFNFIFTKDLFLLLKTTTTKIAPALVNLWQENYESTGRLYLKNKIKQPKKARNLKASLKSKTVLVLGTVLESLPEAAGSCSSFHPVLQSRTVSDRSPLEGHYSCQ